MSSQIASLHQVVKQQDDWRCLTIGVPTLITTLALTIIFAAGMICLIPGVNTMSIVLPVIVPCSVTVLLSLPFFICYCGSSTQREALFDTMKEKLKNELPQGLEEPEDKDDVHPGGLWVINNLLPNQRGDVYNTSVIMTLQNAFDKKNSPREKEIDDALSAALEEIQKRSLPEQAD